MVNYEQARRKLLTPGQDTSSSSSIQEGGLSEDQAPHKATSETHTSPDLEVAPLPSPTSILAGALIASMRSLNKAISEDGLNIEESHCQNRKPSGR